VLDDNPEWTEEDFARAVRVEDLPAEDRDAILAAFPKTAARLGRPLKADKKVAVKLRLDPDVLSHYRDSGPGWQTRINEALRSTLPAA
jgi:uncharacterized protein (DUF4415 family)